MVTILLIEDSAFQRKIITSMLVDLGFDVITAENGYDGVSRILSDKPAVVLSDLLMPDYDGIWVLEQLRVTGIKIPVIIITSDVQKATRDQCTSLGAAGYLNKPVQKDGLESAIGKVLHGASR